MPAFAAFANPRPESIKTLDLLFDQAGLAFERGQTGEASKKYREAAALAHQLRRPVQEARAFHTLGTINSRTGATQEAIEAYFSALRVVGLAAAISRPAH